MKILLVNKFYYRRGGDCTAVFSAEQLLKANGHEVAVFSMEHPQNESTRWEEYFAGEVRFTATATIADKLAATVRIFHSGEVSRKFNRLLSDFMIFSKESSLMFPMIHSFSEPLHGLTFPQGSIKKKSSSAPHGGGIPVHHPSTGGECSC